MKIGYVRATNPEIECSLSIDQQTKMLKEYGCETVLQAEAFQPEIDAEGKVIDRHTGLTAAVKALGPRDLFVCCELVVLGLPVRGLFQLIRDIEKLEHLGPRQKIGGYFVALTDKIDTSKIVGGYPSDLAERLLIMDRKLNYQRVFVSRSTAVKKGKSGGRPALSKDSIAEAEKLLAENLSVREVAKRLGFSPATLYRRIGAKKAD